MPVYGLGASAAVAPILPWPQREDVLRSAS